MVGMGTAVRRGWTVGTCVIVVVLLPAHYTLEGEGNDENVHTILFQ